LLGSGDGWSRITHQPQTFRDVFEAQFAAQPDHIRQFNV
jgi:hypothetical protein